MDHIVSSRDQPGQDHDLVTCAYCGVSCAVDDHGTLVDLTGGDVCTERGDDLTHATEREWVPGTDPFADARVEGPPAYVKPPSPRNRWRWWIVAGSVAASGGVAAAAILLAPGSPGPTSACQAQVERQNTFVASAVADGYPDTLSISQVMAIQMQDLKLIDDALKVCPGDTKIHTLP